MVALFCVVAVVFDVAENLERPSSMTLRGVWSSESIT